MANFYGATSLIGGGAGALDDIDGAQLADNDGALVITPSGDQYSYTLNATSGASESSPGIISPDANASTKRWILKGARLASLQLPSGTQINEISIDGTFAGDSDDAVPTEKAAKTYIDINTLAVASLPGFVVRPKFTWKDADEIYIEPFTYHHQGTSEQLVYCDTQLTKTFTNLAVSDWSYLYLDDSAIVTAGTNLITISELIDSTAEPSWSVSKHGWYNGEDRCIFAVRTDGSSNILEFRVVNDGVLFADKIAIEAGLNISTAWVDSSALVMPSFTTEGIVTIRSSYYAACTSITQYWRTNGQQGTLGHAVGFTNATGAYFSYTVNTLVVVTDDSHLIELKAAGAGSSVILSLNGWKYPAGM